MRPAQRQSQLNVWTPGLTVQNTGWFGIGDRIRLAVDVPDDLRHAGLDHALERDATEGRGRFGIEPDAAVVLRRRDCHAHGAALKIFRAVRHRNGARREIPGAVRRRVVRSCKESVGAGVDEAQGAEAEVLLISRTAIRVAKRYDPARSACTSPNQAERCFSRTVAGSSVVRRELCRGAFGRDLERRRRRPFPEFRSLP
jgi:hypothetical protein